MSARNDLVYAVSLVTVTGTAALLVLGYSWQADATVKICYFITGVATGMLAHTIDKKNFVGSVFSGIFWPVFYLALLLLYVSYWIIPLNKYPWIDREYRS